MDNVPIYGDLIQPNIISSLNGDDVFDGPILYYLRAEGGFMAIEGASGRQRVLTAIDPETLDRARQHFDPENMIAWTVSILSPTSMRDVIKEWSVAGITGFAVWSQPEGPPRCFDLSEFV